MRQPSNVLWLYFLSYMAFCFITGLEFSLSQSLSLIFLFFFCSSVTSVIVLGPLVFPGSCSVSPSSACNWPGDHVQVFLIFQPQCPHSRKRAQVGGEPEIHLILILNLKAHHPTSEVFLWGASWVGQPPRPWPMTVQQKQAGEGPGLGPAPWWSCPPCCLRGLAHGVNMSVYVALFFSPAVPCWFLLNSLCF